MTNHNHSADAALDGAIHTLQQLDGLGEAAYLQNGSILITEAAARAAIADAVTNRIRLLRDLLNDNLGNSPMFRSAELDDRYAIELVRLVTSITGGDHGEA